MRRLILTLLLAGCDSNSQSEHALARVEQATTEDGIADAVFGQPSLNVGTEPPFASSNTTHFPIAVGTNALLAGDPSPMFFVADYGANRVLGVFASSTFSSLLAGQFSYGNKLPNAGGGVTQQTLNGPRAVAFAFEQLAIADTGNHRVLFGNRAVGAIPWNPSVVYGQRNRFDLAARNAGGEIGPDTLAEPKGVAFDATFSPGRLLIADSGNHRVLIFLVSFPVSTMPTCVGQDDCFKGEPNRGAAVSANGLNDPQGLATFNTVGDPLRGYYVADTGNHRVLHFPVPSLTNKPDLVYGQLDDFTTAVPSKGGVTRSSLRDPSAVAVDVDGSIYIADTGHHRVLHFPYGKTVADRVLGQPDFTSGSAPTVASASRMFNPRGVALTASELFVADTGFSRVLRFRRPCDAAKCDDGNPCTDDTCDAIGTCLHQLRTYSKACSPYLCDSITRTCARPCDPTHPCLSPYACVSGTCAIRCVTSAVCVGVGRTCVDGYCCDSACNGPCETCNELKNEGTCLTAPEGPPPALRFCEGASGECGLRCNGAAGDRCQVARSGSACGTESCDGNTVNKRGTCDGAGACSASTANCAPYACEVNACRTSCRFDVDCSTGATCFGGECVTGVGGGAAGGGCAYDRRANGIAAILLALALSFSIRRRR